MHACIRKVLKRNRFHKSSILVRLFTILKCRMLTKISLTFKSIDVRYEQAKVQNIIN